jgi:predicted dehydrogenase
MSPTVKHRVLVSGAGSIGTRHLKNLKAAGLDDLIVVDPNESLAFKIGNELDVSFFTDFSTALAETTPGIVFICTPPAVHVAQAKAAIDAGADVFCEKPLSNTLDGVDALIAAAKAKKAVTMVGCNMRFHPGPAAVKLLLDSGVIGKVISAKVETRSYLPHWRPQQDYKKSYSADPVQGGICLDGIHEIDLALWYLGPATMTGAKTISAESIGLPNVDGMTDIQLKHASGATSAVHLNFIEPEYRRLCEFVGERGRITWDFTEGTTRVFGENGDEIESIAQPKGWQMNDMYVDELAHFLAAVQSRSRTCLPVEESVESLKIALAARKA